MNVAEKSSEGLSRIFEVTVPATDLDEKLSAKIEEIRPQVRLKGFRPGKVPSAHIRKMFGTSIMGDILQELVPQTTQDVLEERKLRPANQPNVDVKSDAEDILKEGKDFTFEISLEVMPEFETLDPKTLKLEKPMAPVADEQVEEATPGGLLGVGTGLDPAITKGDALAGQVAGGLGAILVLTALDSPRAWPLQGRPAWLLFGASALWGYHAFMQYLVIWSGDIPHFAAWYLDRNQAGWLAVFIITCVLFAAPALFLIKPMRRDRLGSAIVPGLVVLAFALETVWRFAPSLDLDPAGGASAAGLVLILAGLFTLLRGARMRQEAAHG